MAKLYKGKQKLLWEIARITPESVSISSIKTHFYLELHQKLYLLLRN